MDAFCFKKLFFEFEDKSKISQNEVKIKSYKTVEDRHLIKTGFITEIIVGLQRIYREQFEDKNLKFDYLVSKIYNRVQSIYVRDDFKKLELISIYLDVSKLEFFYNYYTLKTISSKLFLTFS